MDRRKVGRAALLGSALWTFGLVAATLGELEWRGEIADNPVPDWLSGAAVAAGSVMLLLGLRSFNETYGAGFRLAGRIGYWIAFAGVGISIVAVWPFIIIGPFFAGIGLTLYGIERARLRGAASAGAWMHATCFPAAVVVGVLAALFGYDEGIGTLVFVGFMILGFAAIGLRLMRSADRPQAAPTPAATR